MRRRCVRGKKYWAILAVSMFLGVAIALLLGGIVPEALRWPIGFFVMFMTGYPFYREGVRIAGGQYSFTKHLAGGLLGASIGAILGYLFLD